MKSDAFSEYDAFGPWIYPIGGLNSLPRLFRPYGDAMAGSAMAFKIPRDIERRNATPDMDLYDAVVAVFPDRILYLQRNKGDGESGVIERVVPVDRIDSIERWTCLLEGILTIHAEGTPIVIPYNTVSDNVMRQAVQLIRSFMPDGAPLLPALREASPLEPSLDFMEFGFVTLCGTLIRENPDLSLIAYQRFIKFSVPRRFKNPWLTKLGLKESLKSAFVLLMGRREMVLVSQTHSNRSRSLKGYTYSEAILPLARLVEIGSTESSNAPSLLRARTRNATVELRWEPDNEALRRLLALGKGS